MAAAGLPPLLSEVSARRLHFAADFLDDGSITPMDLRRICWEIASERKAAKEFSPNQPRVPAGDVDGGEWTSDGSSPTAAAEASISARPQSEQQSGRRLTLPALARPAITILRSCQAAAQAYTTMETMRRIGVAQSPRSGRSAAEQPRSGLTATGRCGRRPEMGEYGGAAERFVDFTRRRNALAASPPHRERRFGAVEQHVGDRHPAIGEFARRVGPAIGMVGPHESPPHALQLGERRRISQAQFGGDGVRIVGQRRDRRDGRRDRFESRRGRLGRGRRERVRLRRLARRLDPG